MQRIVIVGNTASGKTTLAKRLSEKFRLRHVELDSLAWGPNWELMPIEVFRPRVEAALSGDAWVVDGNYRKVRDLVWGRADTLIWLDYRLPVLFWRLFWRTLRRLVTREELWAGNRETFQNAFLDSESLFRYANRKYTQHRRDYPAILSTPEYTHLDVLRFNSPRQTTTWFDRL